MSAILLAPHNDDETLFSFFNLVRHQAHVVVVLRSCSEERQGGPRYQHREAETARAMNVAGVTWEQWEYLDADPDWSAIERSIGERIRGFSTVIAPAVEAGGHEQHNEVGRIARFMRTPQSGLISYLTYVRGHGRSDHGTQVIPTDAERGLKELALACYESQATWPPTAPWFGDDQREFVL